MLDHRKTIKTRWYVKRKSRNIKEVNLEKKLPSAVNCKLVEPDVTPLAYRRERTQLPVNTLWFQRLYKGVYLEQGVHVPLRVNRDAVI